MPTIEAMDELETAARAYGDACRSLRQAQIEEVKRRDELNRATQDRVEAQEHAEELKEALARAARTVGR